ncbi:hypothetical protein [Phenylobacterium sp.]|uniref:hypothetical protein n=1 Tax=Phenylobacterium sp. TaxID=1871053 RepID=UPI00301DF5A8
MSEGPDIDTVSLATLDRLAALDLSAAEKAHGALMAAEAKDIPELSRAYRGLARSLRQTLALKDRLRRARPEPARGPSRLDPDRMARAERLDLLADAVRDAAAGQGCDPAEREDLAERFHDEAWDWIERPDFLTEDLDTLIQRARTLMDLDDEDQGSDPEDGSDGDLIEGEAREVFRPEPEPDPSPQTAQPYDDGEGPEAQAADPLPPDPLPPEVPQEPPSQPRSGHRWDIPTHDPPAPVSPPSPDPFANWPRRIVPDHPFNSS